MNKLLSSLTIVVWVAASSLRPAFAGSTDAGKDVPPGSPAEKRNFSLAQASNDLFGALTRMNLSLSKSSTAVGAEGLPAELGFTDDIGKSFAYHADFFLKWSPNTNTSQSVLITPDASVEGHLSSSDITTSDAWRFRAGFEIYMELPGPRPVVKSTLNGGLVSTPSPNWLHGNLNGKFEGNRDFNVTKLMGELEITPDIPSLFIGQTAYHYYIDQEGAKTDRKLSPEEVKAGEPPIDFRWRPYLDVDAGATTDDGTTTAQTGQQPVEKKSTILRLRPRLHADLWLNFVAHALHLRSTTVYVDYEFAYLPLENTSRSHHFFDTGLVLGLTKNIGFDLTYTVGEQSPSFAHEHKLVGALTVAF